MFSAIKRGEMLLQGVTYMARVRGGHAQILVNSDYDGIRVVDPIAQREVGAIPYPYIDPNAEDPFSIYAWVVSPDGNLSYAFSPGETDYAVEFDLLKLAAKRITVPDVFIVPTELAWFGPSFRILDYRGVVWTIDKHTFVEADVKIAQETYTDRLREITREFTVIKMDATGRGIYVVRRKGPPEEGHLSLDWKKSLLVPKDNASVDLTHYEDAAFLVYETHVVQCRGGHERVVATATKQEYFTRANVITAGETAYLTVLSSTKDHIAGSAGRLDVFELR